jgi:C-terminal processing protease CtpA/Prc
VCSYLFGAEPVHLIDVIGRPGADGTAQVRQSWTMPFTPGRRFGPDKPVFVLTSGTTFSGAEELSYDLQQLGRATVVGERTRGGAHPTERFRIRPHLQAVIPVARALSPASGGNWEGTGVRPDVEVPAGEALGAAYQRALAHVLTLGDEGARGETAAEARRPLDAWSGDAWSEDVWSGTPDRSTAHA